MNAIVFGGAGFIGSNLIDRLLKDPENLVLCVDNLQTGKIDNVYPHLTNKHFRLLVDDVTTYYRGLFFLESNLLPEIDAFLDNKVDEIYNFACPASPNKYQADPLHTIRTSMALDILCVLSMDYGAKILQASTSEVYGEPLVSPQNEDYRGNVNTVGIRSCYDEGKRIAETIMFEHHRIGCRGKLIRIFNTYGPKMDPKDGRVVSNFICQALQGENITIYGDGSQTRSFQYIDDLLDGVERVMNTPDDNLGPFNLGNPGEFTIQELALKVLEKTGSQSKVVYEPLPQDDPTNRRPDITKAKELLCWEPKIDLNEGLDRTIEYFKNTMV